MNVRRALFIAALAVAAVAAPASAQVQPAPAGPNPFDNPPARAGANPFDNPPQQQGEPPCIKDFSRLRDDTEKHANAVMAAQKRKVPLPEACKYLTAFATSEEKLLKYAKDNASSCGIPAQLIQQISMGYANVSKARTKVCQMAAAPPAAAGPSLSDALGGGIPDRSNIKTGRGTFDTLTGTPLGSK